MRSLITGQLTDIVQNVIDNAFSVVKYNVQTVAWHRVHTFNFRYHCNASFRAAAASLNPDYPTFQGDFSGF